MPSLTDWHPHFAWWPVTCTDGREAWLVHVQRRWQPASKTWQHRLPGRLMSPVGCWA